MTRSADFGPGESLAGRPVFDGETESERGEIDTVPGDVRPHVGGRDGRSVLVENSQTRPRG